MTGRLRPLSVAVVASTAAAVHLVLQTSMFLGRPGLLTGSFRSYYSTDQLSYLAIVVDASRGRSTDSEPFTGTGVSDYPRLWYLVLGHAAHLLGLEPAQAWTLGGLAAQAVVVAAVSTATVLLTRRAWTGLLAPLPFVLGTFASASGSGWYVQLDGHAVLWGPFGVLFTLNGESVALCLAGTAMLLLLVTWTRVRGRAPRIALTLVACAALGSTANIQTYAFLVSVYLVAFVVAVVFLLLERRTWLTVLSVALVPVVLLVGQDVATAAGPLAALLSGLLPAAPGLVAGALRTRGVLVLFAASAAATAAPQLLGTVTGIVRDDPFLAYRVASSHDLGVDARGVLGASAVLLPLLGVLVAGVVVRRVLWIAHPVGVVVAWALTATNDRWGADQEPYRFWLDAYVLVAVTVLPVVGSVVVGLLGRREGDPAGRDVPRRRGSVRAHVPAAPPGTPRRSATGARTVTTAVLAVCLVVAALSATDFVRFHGDPENRVLLDWDAPRDDAIRSATSSLTVGDGGARAPEATLLLPDPCIDVLALKVVTGVPVAYFNPGLAWPADEPAVRAVVEDRDAGVLDFSHAADAGVEWVLTDSACTAADWESTHRAGLTTLDTARYGSGTGSGTITLWHLSDR